MIRILGTPRRLCDGLTRRDLLHIGGLGAFGFALSDLFGLGQLSAASTARPAGFGKAKACILLYKYGSPSQHETVGSVPRLAATLGNASAVLSLWLGTLRRIGEVRRRQE